MTSRRRAGARRWAARAGREWGRLPWWVQVPVVLVVAWALVSAIVWATQRPTGIEQAADACKVGLNVRDDGKSLTIQFAEGEAIELGRWMSPDAASCVFDELEVPASIRERLIGTRPVDGQLQDSWGDYTIRWWVSGDEASIIVMED